MKTQSHVNRFMFLSLSASLLMGFALNTKAANATWSGSGDGVSWSSTPNWSAAFPSATTDTATFSTTPAAITSLGTNISIAEIVTGTAAVTITDASHTLTLNGTSALAVGNGGLTLNTSTAINVVNTAITLGSGTLTFGGSGLAIGSKTLTFSGAAGTVVFNSTASGGGTLLNQGLTMDANANITAGKIQFGSASAGKTGGFFISTSGVAVSSAIALTAQTTGSGASTFTIGVGAGTNGTGTYSGGLNITNGSAGSDSILLNAASGNTLFYTGAIAGSNAGTGLSLGTSGTGTVVLSGANTYTLATSIASGSTLEFAKTAAMSTTSTVTAASGSTLAVAVGGTGQFTTTGTGTGTGTLAGIFSGVGGQTGSVVSLTSGSTVGIDTGSNTVSYGNAITNAIGIKKLGSGSLALTGTSTYNGTTTVAAGTLVLGNGSGTVSTTTGNNTNGSAVGTGPLVVSPGATLAGAGTAQVSSFNISGASALNTALVLVGQTSAGDTNTTGALTLLGGTGAGNSTIANANLTFNLDQSNVGAGNTLNVGGTGISFGANVTLALNLQNAGVVPANSPYILIAGTGSTTIGGGGATSGQYAGLQTFVNSQGFNQILNSGNGLGGNVALALSGQAASWYGNGSYLYLVNTGGVDDIDVEVVPEPGTWAMMLGGLAVLIVWQRRKSKA